MRPHALARGAAVRAAGRARLSATPHSVTRHSASRTIAPLILLVPALALDERDRHLDDPEPAPHGSPGQVDLEAVALRRHLARGRAPPASACGRRGSRRSRRAAAGRASIRDVGVAAAGQQLAAQRPVDDLPAGHPARAEHQVGVAQRGQQPRQLLGLVRAVGVHLDQRRRSPRSSPQREPGDVRRAEPCLARPVQHVHLAGRRRPARRRSRRCRPGCCRRRPGRPRRARPRAAGRRRARRCRLVVRRDDDQHPAAAPAPAAHRRLRHDAVPVAASSDAATAAAARPSAREHPLGHGTRPGWPACAPVRKRDVGHRGSSRRQLAGPGLHATVRAR